MADFYTAVQRYAGSQAPANLTTYWNVLGGDEAAGTTRALYDSSGTETSGAVTLVSNPNGGTSNIGSIQEGELTGDAVWVNEAIIANNAINVRAAGVSVRYTGFLPGETRIIEAFGHQTITASRGLTLSVNGSTPVEVPQYNNLNAVGSVEVEADANGEFLVTLTGSDANNNSYIQAIRIIEPAAPSPSITITQSELTPGGTISGTASNFSAAPTTISLSDGASPVLNPALTVTSSGDDYTFSALIPDFKSLADTAGEGNPVQGLRIGTITATVE